MGRFLSPDPFVQAPDFTQNFNRYSYALNNPLRYTDESGELLETIFTGFMGTVLTAGLRLPLVLFTGVVGPFFAGFLDTAEAGQMFRDAWTDYGQRVSNAFKIDMGLFQTDSDISVVENILTILSRFTWEDVNRHTGSFVSHFRNNLFSVEVEYYHGSTLVNMDDPSVDGWGMTIGSYANGVNMEPDPEHNSLFAHEYGHTKQSKILGPLYLPIVGLPSLIGNGVAELGEHNHDYEWYEVWANQLSYNYFDRIGYSNVTGSWSSNNPRTHQIDDYFYLTMVYYAGLAIAAVAILI